MNIESDSFELFDLKVEVVGNQNKMVCSHRVGDHFFVQGENISFPEQQGFSLYAMAALLPLLPAKQRQTDLNDWMSTDELIACPDPNCGARFRITRTGKSVFHHSQVTATPLKSGIREPNDA